MRIAIIGCGQLAQMLALAGIPLGIKFSFLADEGKQTDTQCVTGLGEIVVRNGHDTVEQLYRQLHCPDIVTVEKEHVDASLLRAFSEHCEVHPGHKAVSVCQHRYREKSMLDSLNIPTAHYAYLSNAQDMMSVRERFEYPFVIKSAVNGYDGKQQWRISSEQDVKNFLAEEHQGDFVVEQWVPFYKEVSLVAARDKRGSVDFYTLTENLHQDGILISSVAPASDISDVNIKTLQHYLTNIAEALDYVGVIAMECFVTKEQILVNELAPRVHNSGHWTQEGAYTCQFENHIRAISGLPLGKTKLHSVTGMLNLLGTKSPPTHLLTDGSTLHWYHKTSRPGRKLGHVNFIAESRVNLEALMKQFQSSM